MIDNISDNLKTVMIRVGRAIAKAVGEDIRNYIATNENVLIMRCRFCVEITFIPI